MAYHASIVERKRIKVEVKSEPNNMTAKEFYMSCSTDALVRLLLSKDALIDKQKSKMNLLRNLAAKWRNKSWKSHRKWKPVSSQHRKNKKVQRADKYHIGNGTKKSVLSPWGGITSAIMRSVASCSAWRTGVALQTDISRQTVVRF